MSEVLIDQIRRQAENNALSNHRLLTACAQLDHAAFVATRTSFFPSIHLTLDHIYCVDVYYLDTIEENGRGRAAFDKEPLFDSFAPLAEAQRESDRRLMAFCDRLGPGDVDRTVTMFRYDGSRPRERIGDVLQHLFVHQIHHRGQVHAMLAGTPVPPPQLDEYFLAMDAPLRDTDRAALAALRARAL
jgi:uncharacterized damage-inducible protein DinB